MMEAGRHAADLGIGQSFLTATPLQIVRPLAAMGNAGALYRPQLVGRVQSAKAEMRHL